jgi:hypothetical protein
MPGNFPYGDAIIALLAPRRPSGVFSCCEAEWLKL